MIVKSDLLNHVDRAKGDEQAVVFYGDRGFIQGGELNESQTIAANRSRRVSNLIASNGNRISGAQAVVNVADQTVTLSVGEIYVAGDVLPIAATTISPVGMVGGVEIGVRLVRSIVTHEEDPALLGIPAGANSEGEPGAAREVFTISWALSDDGADGEFVTVYLLQDGTIVDQTPPPALDGIRNAIAVGIEDANGGFIDKGCRVTALGADAGDQLFSIEEGVAYIRGFRRTREAAFRHREPEVFDVAAVPGETHTYSPGASFTFGVHHTPIAAITSIQLEKEHTETVTRGGTANGADGLTHNSVQSLVSIVRGGTTYIVGADCSLVSDNVDWGIAGAEPAAGETYVATYIYFDSVTADSFTPNDITLSGGADGGRIIVGYTHKLPRIDLICFDVVGLPAYVKGISSDTVKLPPIAPDGLLKLAEIHNDWISKPRVVNNGIYGRSMADIDRLARSHQRLIRQAIIERSESQIDRREAVASRGLVVDPFLDDSLRDQGEAQTAAIIDGVLQLSITETLYGTPLSAPVTLDYIEEVIISQEQATACEKIAPYLVFTPVPASMALSPPVDFWTVNETDWTSPVTRQFTNGVRADNGPLRTEDITTAEVDSRVEQVEFLREIPIEISISGFGGGENLSVLTFDDIDVKPAGVQTADVDGKMIVTFTIPANVTSGTKLVHAQGQGLSFASSLFTGQGTIDIAVMQQVTTVNTWVPPAVVPVVVAQSNSDDDDDRDSSNWGGWDPQAQIFRPDEPRHIVGVDIKLCAIGDESNPVLVQQVTVDNGYPTTDVRAASLQSMQGAVAGWKAFRFDLPLLTPSDRKSAFNVKTEDTNHQLSIANGGEFDEDAQAWVTDHPNVVGPRFSSVNGETWTAHQKSALTFRVVAAKFTNLTKIVDLGSHALVNHSDLHVRAVTETAPGTSIVFEIELANGTIYRLPENRNLQLAEALTETVQLRAILTGTEKLSPVLYGHVMLVAGEIATAGTYVARTFELGAAVRLTTWFKAFLPAGATVLVEYDLTNGGVPENNWRELPHVVSDALAVSNWFEPKHELDPVTAEQARLRINLTGGPAARVKVGHFGAAIY